MLNRIAVSRLLPLSALSFFGLLALTVGCSHGAPRAETAAPVQASAAPSVQGAPYQAALAAAFGEADERLAYRGPAQASGTGINLQQLNQISPGKFKIFVFPKLSGITNKTSEDDKPLYSNANDERFSRLGKPVEYEVSTLAESPCLQFIEKNQFAKYGAKEFFDAALAQDRGRRCAIIEITSLRMKNANRALIKRDDALRVRLFLDDTYNLHGYEMEKFVNSQNTRVTRVKTGGTQIASSGLSLFPMDIPSLEVLGRPTSSKASFDAAQKIDKLAVSQVRKSFMGAFKTASCDGTQARYTDYYGSKVEVGWCNNNPFPQYMENSRFVAITQPLSVR